MEGKTIAVVAYAAIMVVISTVSLSLRFFSRRIHGEKIWYDDWAVTLGWFFQLAPAVNVIIFENLQERLIDTNVFEGDLPRAPEQSELFFALSYAFFALYGLSISFTKWATLLFYWRLFSSVRWMRMSIIGISIAIAGWTLGAVVTWLAQCKPITKAWNTEEPGTCINFYLFALLINSINLVTDVVILVLPVPIILKLNTTTGKKISLLCAFGIGGFVCVITAVRLSFITQGGTSPKFASSRILSWTLAEVSAAVICANLPFLYALAIHYLPPSTKKVFRHGYTSRQRTTEDAIPSVSRSKSKSHRQISLPLSVFRQDSEVDEDQLRMISTSPGSTHKAEDDAIYVTRDFDVRRNTARSTDIYDRNPSR
ncbi:hypothetical protein B9Z65_7144 [Elsinoe australis]|uniref:Rhodopsin domain-containing protein n=1 Tax=Elsinoe australis TaxID=40998 RepID=A0A2P7Z5X4_9PEZI|nr:hypothetical protein B9Z65_7144 [Elsinoe australis]